MRSDTSYKFYVLIFFFINSFYSGACFKHTVGNDFYKRVVLKNWFPSSPNWHKNDFFSDRATIHWKKTFFFCAKLNLREKQIFECNSVVKVVKLISHGRTYLADEGTNNDSKVVGHLIRLKLFTFARSVNRAFRNYRISAKWRNLLI